MRKLLCLILSLALLIPLGVLATEKEITLDSEADFLRFAENCRLDSYSQGLTVKLRRDLDLTGLPFEGIPTFSGTFEGQGFRITGLSLTHAGSHVGLFRYLTAEAVVRDLRVEGTAAPTGSREYVGGIAGENAGRIENCSFSGTVSGSQYVGGIAGTQKLTGILEACTVSGSVQGTHFVGGLAGENTGVIRDSENTASVNTLLEQNSVSLEDITLDALTGSESAATVTDIGGIVGTGSGVIRDCRNRGDVGYPQIGYNIGGIIGSTSGYLYGCENTGNVRGRKEVGGIVGQLEPAMNILFSEDALQQLQSQMSGLGGIASSLGSHAQSGASALRDQAQKLDTQVSNAKDAISMLAPSKEFPFVPDLDTVQASKNALSSSISGMNESVTSMVSISKSTMNTLSSDIQKLAGQMSAIGGTVSTASENLGATVSDISDLDTPEDLTAKLQSCRNAGAVSGDWNIGGIAGAIAIENDLDPESDLDLAGEYSLNFDMELRSVLLECQSAGAVTGGKQNVGGIVGWMSLGLVKGCLSTAPVDASAADYTGGIAGRSRGAIRECVFRGSLRGAAYSGGIAGSGEAVSVCAAIVELLSTSQFRGAILGDGKNASLTGNFYLPVNRDPGAVDGISYEGLAQPLEQEAFFALESLPKDLRLITLRFRFSDGTEALRTLPYGTRLTQDHFPALPLLEGAEGHWESPVDIGDPLCYDTLVEAVYESHSYTLASPQTDRLGLPLALLQGDFLPGSALALQKRDTAALEAWDLSLPESRIPRKLRYLLPEDRRDANVTVMGLVHGSWERLPHSLSGSYLVFDVPEGLTAIELREAPEDNSTFLYAIVAAAAGLSLLLTVILVRRSRQKKAKEETAEAIAN